MRAAVKLDRLTVESFVRPVSSREINAAIDAEREASAKGFRARRARFAICDLGYPAIRYGVWDFQRRKMVRDDMRALQFTRKDSADRYVASLNRKGAA